LKQRSDKKAIYWFDGIDAKQTSTTIDIDERRGQQVARREDFANNN
jgi:hypothetical protein